ncbi:cysteine dioxygenase [Bacillus sp. SCS-153A]|uniref:cysteine dioxygenase n=1 Tax=Rossellomorea sedimentorum TaxID=3115294 RepID=UPI003905916A
MSLTRKAKEQLDALYNPSKAELKDVLLDLKVTLQEVEGHLKSAGEKPYYRKLLYQNEEVELLIMNWSQLECAPHDHGESQGWIQVLAGTSVNAVYEIDGKGWPSQLFEEQHHQGKFFYAPKRGVHQMKAEGGKELVTLHLYSPPISGMKVYDLEKCAVCIVSDDCGAWWPEDQKQKVKEIQLEQR